MLMRFILYGCLCLLVACGPKFTAPSGQAATPSIVAGSFVSFDGSELPLHQWLPDQAPRAVLIALHGFNDYGLFIDAAARWWSARGVAVFAWDQRGFGATLKHGFWPGRMLFASDVQVFVSLMHRRYPDTPVYLLGESMGGAVALEALAEWKLPVDGVILSAPAVRGWEAMPWWQRWGLKIGARLMPWTRFTGESLGVVASDNRAMLIALGRAPLVIKKTRVDTIYGLVGLMQAASESVDHVNIPMLVLHGDRDEVIPAAVINAAFAGLDGKHQQLVRYKNGYHMLLRDLQAEVVWRDILAWMQDRNALLPSRQVAQP